MAVARDSMLIVLAAFLIRYTLHQVIEPYAVFHFFMVACVIVAIRYGYKAAFLSLIPSFLLGNYFFIRPYGQFAIISVDDLIQIFNFILVTGSAILAIEKLQRTIYSQKLLIQVMRDRQRSLLYQQNELVNKLRNVNKHP